MKALKAMKRFFKYSAVLGVLGALLFPIYGCPDFPSTISEGVASNPVTLFGKVIDSQTRQGIGDAKVYVKVNGEWTSATADSSTDTNAGDDTVGDFKFTGLPPGATVPYVIAGPTATGSVAYLKAKGTWTTPAPTAVNSAISFDTGQTSMEVGIKVTVRVVDSSTGNYIAKVDSSGTALSIPIYRGFPVAGSSVEADIATQDATDTDKYTITIPQTGSSTLSVASLDNDGDGDYDYQSGTRAITASGGITSGAGELTTNIVLSPITPGTTLSVVASNVQTDQDGSGYIEASEATTNGIKYFFNMPISALPTTGEDAVTLTYTDSFKSLTSAAVTAEMAVSAALSGDNTLLSITPSSTLTENQTYTVGGIVTRAVDGADSDLRTAVTAALATMYVPATGTSSLGGTDSNIVTVDNFNYWASGSVITSGDTQTLATGTLNLVFPEKVWGEIRLVSAPSLSAVVQPQVLAGTLTFTNALVAVAGTSTSFVNELAVGDTITAPNGVAYTVAAIADATNLTLTVVYAGTTSPAGGETAWVSGRAGTLACTADSSNVSGTNTLFSEDLAIGDVITFYGATISNTARFYKISAVTATALTVSPVVDTTDVATCNAVGVSGLQKLATTYYPNTVGSISDIPLPVPAITWLPKVTSQDPTASSNTNKGSNRTVPAGSDGVPAYQIDLSIAPFSLINMPDSTTEIPLEITVGIDVTDAQGNAYTAETALPIN